MNPTSRRLANALGATVAATALAFGVGAPPERCPDITVTDVEQAAGAAAGWIIDNQLPDGTWLYEYDRDTDVATDDYNVVRHAGVMSSLYQSAARGIEGAQESADLGLAWALDHVVERDDWMGVTTGSNIQAGTNALMVAVSTSAPGNSLWALRQRRSNNINNTPDAPTAPAADGAK